MLNSMERHDYFRHDLNSLVSRYYSKGRFKDKRNGQVYASGCLDAIDSTKVQFLSERTKDFVQLSLDDLRFLELVE